MSLALIDAATAVHEPIEAFVPPEQRWSKKLDGWYTGNPKKPNLNFMRDICAPHIESFDFFLDEGLNRITENLPSVTIISPACPETTLSITRLELSKPSTRVGGKIINTTPMECREAQLTYSSPLTATLRRECEGIIDEFQLSLGDMPIMVGSKRCMMSTLSPDELRYIREDSAEAGGYFIINGNERLIRLLIQPRRHMGTCMDRGAYMKRGSSFTTKAISFRSVRSDERSQTLVLHAQQDGSALLRVLIRKREYFLPLVLIMRALKESTDLEIFTSITHGDDDTFLSERLELMLHDSHGSGLFRQADVISFLGSKFKAVMYLKDRTDLSDMAIGRMFLARHVFWHLGEDGPAKFDLLALMARQLYALTAGNLNPDSTDATSHHELLLPGNLVCQMLSEQLEDALVSLKRGLVRESERPGSSVDPTKKSWFQQTIIKRYCPDIGKAFNYFLATGNLRSSTGLDMMQVSGYAVVADRINGLRFMAHFRSVHRGAFFTEMKTTAVRKLRPESFGFLCCVHTPDGAPCGLLMHLTASCRPTVNEPDTAGRQDIVQLLLGLGMTPPQLPASDSLPAMLDGRLIGWLGNDIAPSVVTSLRHAKSEGSVWSELEMALVLPNRNKLMPCLQMFTNRGRFIRPVRSLATGKIEKLGSLEQLFLDVAIYGNEVIAGVTTHQELSPMSMLSVVASITPFSDHNQSPRNMYQCQMIKQTMGFHTQAIDVRTDNKSYRIQTPQRPLVRTVMHDRGNMDRLPTGTNAVVAVLSHTGYDMEDACIIKRAALDRGMFHGVVYTTHNHNLRGPREQMAVEFAPTFNNLNDDETRVEPTLDEDGLPPVGLHLKKGSPMLCVFRPLSNNHRVIRYDKGEAGWVDRVIVLGYNAENKISHVRIVVRHDRGPIVGDKFSSRHGQKGVLGIKWPQRDMPFTSTGITPDLIINPHAFPSRMTIGMLVESICGKLGIETGKTIDATPFQWSDERRAVDEIGNELHKLGFSRFGSEQMYSGLHGCPMKADIFIGVVHYQRLRHMVTDKYQVRAKGSNDQVTRQPVKGRKRGGGVRFGEMERDAMIAHGSTALLRGRLCTDSDAEFARVCPSCGSMVSRCRGQRDCRDCGSDRAPTVVEVPAVTSLLAHELAAMGVKMHCEIEE
eukprot:gnl/Dysnectes_brevis/1713_a1948_1606.p1 GENE.gnl/Dysnectes_brevis/1713_a1948_1606~~gnl/Dysnectes_brevis/1713_a1948_1606.p1  ORF type:complete len:1139 (-),score=414.09 gnl/Dysnectes_brevis/1713_a1948_1606:136-3552(-)